MSHHNRLDFFVLTVGLVGPLCLGTIAPAQDAAEAKPSGFVLENKHLSYAVTLRERDYAEVTIVNKALGEKHVFPSSLFMVTTEDRLATILRSQVHKVATSGEAGEVQTAVLSTTCPRAGFSISVLYELGPDDFFVKKSIGVSRLEPGDEVVNRIDVDVFQLPESKDVVEFRGLGQPVYYRDLFFGVEYPACTILHDGRGRVRLGYEYGLSVGMTAVGSHTAVIGVAPDGNVSRSFLKYVDSIRSRPPRPLVLWNSWYDLRDFNEAAVLESLRLLREKFCQPYGIRLDSVVLDDGWDNHRSLWNVAEDRFPNGFETIEKEALKTSSGLGFWLSPWGGYGEAQKERMAYGRVEGFELLQTPGFRQEGFCLAALRYKKRFQECAMDFVRQYQTTYLKFDGFPSFCQDRLHGHRIGLYSQVAMTDAFLEILDSLKKQKRSLFINITTGTWHSPWWLQHADAVWMQGNDYGHDGWGSVRQKSITYKDWRMYIAFRENRAQYPFDALMTVGILKGRHDTGAYRTPEADESEKDWQDHVMMNLGMGTLHLELYISPSIMSEKELAFLGEKIRWWLDNAAVLSHTRMILGNPHEGEAYGYAHFPQDGRTGRAGPPPRGFIFLRNPSLQEKKAEVTLDDSIDLPLRATGRPVAQASRLPFTVRTIYPAIQESAQQAARGDKLSFQLAPLETRVIEVQWQGN